MKKINFDDLIKSRQIQIELNIGHDQVERLMKRAEKDLKTAVKIRDIDPALTMDMAYKAMFHAAGALLRTYKLRPGPFRQHQGVIEAIGRVLGKDTKIILIEFDRLRKKRNQFEYQGEFEMGIQELDEALDRAKELVDIIRKKLNHPLLD